MIARAVIEFDRAGLAPALQCALMLTACPRMEELTPMQHLPPSRLDNHGARHSRRGHAHTLSEASECRFSASYASIEGPRTM
jgi:hypothetical protein